MEKYIILFLIQFTFAATKPTMAVLDLVASGLPAQEGEVISERLRTELFKSKKYMVVERNQMNMILSEQSLQQTGCVKSECAVQIGQLIGVDLMMAGTISKVQNKYYISLRMIDVESGAVLKAVDDMKSFDLSNAMEHGVLRLLAKLDGDPVPAELSKSGDTIIVSTAEELITAIKSNAIIALNPGTYNLSKQSRVRNRNITWNDNFDGKYPVVKGVHNLTMVMRGAGKAEVLIDPAYGWVLEFKESKNITIKDLIFGHTTPGNCIGGVLRFEDSENINLSNLDLFGSGTYGLELKSSSNIHVAKTVIRECTYGIMVLDEVQNVRFTECEMINSKEYTLVSMESSSNVNFDRCLFKGNQGSEMFAISESNEGVSFEMCRIENNVARVFSKTKNSFSMTSTSFSNNRFDIPDANLRKMKILEK